MKKFYRALRVLREANQSPERCIKNAQHNSDFIFENLKLAGLLTEQDEDLFGAEEETEEETEEEVEETGEAGEEVEEETETEVVQITPGDEVRFGKQLDAALDSLLADFEMKALKSAAVNAPQEVEEIEIQAEWWNQPLAVLLEQEEVVEEVVEETDFDIESFAEDVGRLIQNYDSLLDMEGIIFNKAMDFLQTKYGQDVASTFEEILQMRYDLYLGDEADTNPNDLAAPIAVGATGGGEMGGG